VTGATSFILVPFIESLRDEGHTVYAVARPGSRNLDRLSLGRSGIQVIELAMEHIDELPQYISCAPDAFFHFAWDGPGSDNRKLESVQEKNIEDSSKALEIAIALGCSRFVFSGSQAEYGIHHELIGEDCLCHPDSPYGKAKLAFGTHAAIRCKEAGIDFVHLRIFSVYGPGMHEFALVPSCLSAFSSGKAIELSSCEQLWNYLYTRDLGEALYAILIHKGRLADHGEVYNVAGAQTDTRPLKEYVEDIWEFCGSKGSCLYGERALNAEGEVNLIPDTAKIRRVIGWESRTSFKRGLEEMVHYRNTNRGM
jgi:nucleoside-diphosphate-sugar epimerase